MTLREMIDGYRSRLLTEKDMKGDEASQILVELSALSGNVSDEIIDREMQFNRLLNEILSTPNMTAASAKIRALASEEYEAMLRAKATFELVKDITRALKYRLRSLADEQQLSRNQ